MHILARYHEKALHRGLFKKKRHQTTFHRYKSKHKFFLSLEPLSRWIYYFLIPVILLIDVRLWMLIITPAFIRLIIQYIVYYFSTKTLNEKDLLLFSPVFDLIQLFIDLIVKMSKNPYRKSTWK